MRSDERSEELRSQQFMERVSNIESLERKFLPSMEVVLVPPIFSKIMCKSRKGFPVNIFERQRRVRHPQHKNLYN